MDSTRLWPEDMRSMSHSCDWVSLEKIRSRIDDIQTLKDVEKSLRLLTENLKTVITSSCAAVLPATRQFGFALLPDEHHLNATFDYHFVECPFKFLLLTFPAAKTLVFDMAQPIHDPGIFPMWNFPEMRSLEARTDFQPQDMRFCYESLKSFSYQPYEQTFLDSSVMFMETLINFLRPAISLSTLHLDVSYIDAFDGFDSELQAELPAVQVFSISNWRRGLEWEFIEPFEPDPIREDSLARIIRAMKMRNARDISAPMVFNQTEGIFILSEWLSAAFPESYGMRSVSNVTFKILDLPVTGPCERAVVRISGLFESFQALESRVRKSPVTPDQVQWRVLRFVFGCTSSHG
ncbi:hypothetical protein ACEPAG_6650 [Sanghuangporus baumii]